MIHALKPLAALILLALPAGAAADILDRRHYLIGAQAWVLSVATLLALLTWAGWLGPWGLLFFTFCIGMGSSTTHSHRAFGPSDVGFHATSIISHFSVRSIS